MSAEKITGRRGRFAALVDGYDPPSDAADELVDPNGDVRPVWDQFLRRFSRHTTAEVDRRFHRAEQYLHDAGVYYREYDHGDSRERAWPLSHIPVLLSDTDWATISEALLQRAEAEGFVIVEDDYEFELAFQGAPSPALKSLDRHGFVIYTGSFSKSLFPGLRLGYMVGSERFMEQARALRAMLYRHPPGLIQRTTAYFLSLGHYDAQVERMGRAFRKRRGIMEQALRDHRLDVVNPAVSGGSSFWLRAPERLDTAELALRLRSESVLIEPGHTFFAPGQQSYRFYRLAYSSIASARIPEGISRIAQAQQAMRSG